MEEDKKCFIVSSIFGHYICRLLIGELGDNYSDHSFSKRHFASMLVGDPYYQPYRKYVKI